MQPKMSSAQVVCSIYLLTLTNYVSLEDSLDSGQSAPMQSAPIGAV